VRVIAFVFVCAASCVFLGAPPVSATPFAAEVVSYTAGTNVATGYDNPATALGAPLRSTGSGPFDGDVTPFNAPYRSSDVVSIGAGGELVVRFDHPVADDASNSYGIDLLIYGNSFLGVDFDSGLADGTLFDEPGAIAVSQDGTHWVDVSGVFADSLFPTLAYQDPTGPFSSGGSVPTNFTRAVNPALSAASFAGLTVQEIAALYGGAAGGAGIDLGALGLPWIQYVRVSQSATDSWSTDIDAFADVPEPGAAALFAVGALALTWSRARTRRPTRAAEACARTSARV
jgi:hypothetical protein